jgi:hypothetical protein
MKRNTRSPWIAFGWLIGVAFISGVLLVSLHFMPPPKKHTLTCLNPVKECHPGADMMLGANTNVP